MTYLTPRERAELDALLAIPPDDWREWLQLLFPNSVRWGFAPHHERFWNWLWSIRSDRKPDPFVGVWARGGAKSSSAELGACALGLRGRRRYGLYVRDTQERADDSVQNVASLLESRAVDRYYPAHGRRRANKFGASKGWRRNRIRTEADFTIDALGLDVAARGVKLEDQRPDFIIFDDIDGRHDSPKMTEKKLTTIKESVLPAGTANCAVIAIQNLIIPHGIFARLAGGTADMLLDRILSGPVPALIGLKTVPHVLPNGMTYQRIVAGKPTWEGQGIDACQALLITIGYHSFRREAQHEVADREGALWTRAIIENNRRSERSRYKRVAVGVDPSGGGTEIGITAGGLRYDSHVDILADRTQKGALGPRNWARHAVDLYWELEADVLVAERNFGGDMVRSTIHTVDPNVNVKMVHASRGKDVRAEPVASLYGDPKHPEVPGRVHHIGDFPELETEQTGWVPGDPESPNRMDSLVWVVTELVLGHQPMDLDSANWKRARIS